MRIVRAAAICMACLLAAGCGQQVVATADPDLSAEETIDVVTTTGMITDVVENVGGERVEVTGLMGPGVDPHLYKASEGDVRRLDGADLVLFNGLHLEAKLAEVLERLDDKAEAVTDSIDRGRLLAPPQFKGQYDPHVWFDVRLWTEAVAEIRDVLVARDPADAAAYRANAARYLRELRELDTWISRRAASVPPSQRVLVTAHDAFNYFGRAYGFDVRGLQGISTATEAGAGDVQRLAAFIAARQIRTIFVETSVSPRAVEAVRAAVRSRGFDVQIGEQLYSDAMGEPGTPQGTYIGMVRHNVDAIVDGLRGEGR